MPRAPKLRKKNGYWMTKAGGGETYFGKVTEVVFKDARDAFLAHVKASGTSRKMAVVTIEVVCDLHLEWVAKERSLALYKQRKYFLDRWCDFEVRQGSRSVLLRDLPYNRVGKDVLIAWKDHLLQSVGKSTVSSAVRAIKATWNWAAQDATGPFPEDFAPFARVARVRLDKKALTEVDLLTDAERDLLFAHANADLGKVRGKDGRYRTRTPNEYRSATKHPYARFEDLLRCYFHTGARTSELANCRVRDFLVRTRQVVLGEHKRSRTMKDSLPRRITLNTEAFAIFKRWAASKKADDYVFAQTSGRPLTKDLIAERFRAVREIAGIRDSITVYSFRHLWISEALMAGNDIATVAKMAGTSIKMIEEVYGHFRNDHFEEAQRKLDDDRAQRASKAFSPTSA